MYLLHIDFINLPHTESIVNEVRYFHRENVPLPATAFNWSFSTEPCSENTSMNRFRFFGLKIGAMTFRRGRQIFTEKIIR